jgi:hypothetical protein
MSSMASGNLSIWGGYIGIHYVNRSRKWRSWRSW